MRDLFVGVDIGTTSMKAVAYDEERAALAAASVPTRWFRDDHGGTCLDLDALEAGLRELLTEVGAAAPSGSTVRSIGVAGMAETGVLLDAANRPVWPAIAWHDGRGADELARISHALPEVASSFSYRTGLPYDPQASFAKIAWLGANVGGAERGTTWLSIPEYAAFLLTGTLAGERSLMSRTGLIDHVADAPWKSALDALGLADVLPPVRVAGAPWGTVQPGLTSKNARLLDGAVVTVAGHDHVVAAQAMGTTAPGQVFNSCGTADVVLRIVDRWPTPQAFAALAPLNISLGYHPIPGQFVVNGGTKSGLVMRRLTSLLGPVPDDALPAHHDGVALHLPDYGHDRLLLEIDTDVSASEAWNSALAATSNHSRCAMDLVEEHFGPYTSVVCGGGWTRVPAVRRAREHTYRNVSFTTIDEPGCLGAALAARAAHAAPAAPTQGVNRDPETHRPRRSDPEGTVTI